MRQLLLITALMTCPFASALSAEPAESPASASEGGSSTEETVKKEGQELVADTKEHVDKIAKQVDADPRAKDISAGILKPIYQFAEFLSFPAFHWVAFAAMVAGVVSFGFQLVLGKLVVLSKMSLSPSEILSDAFGLVISLVGLVLTTQAAAENSEFTASPFAVISSAAAGAICGLIFYRWGQAQELQAVAGRRTPAPPPSK
jgi:hypothetical protein